MATLEQLGIALKNADRAGDTEAATKLAKEIGRIRRGQETPTETAEPEAEGDGIALNTTAGLNQSIYNTFGAPVDFSRWLINKGIEGANAVTGSEMSTIPTDSFGGSDSISRMFGAVGVPEPKDVRAGSMEERIARGVGEGVGYTVGPSAIVGGAARAGALTGRGLDTASRLFGNPTTLGRAAGEMFVGGTSGAGASAAMEATPDRYDTLGALGGGLAGGGVGALLASIPAMARAGGRMAMDAAAPLHEAGREQLAARRLAESATDPYAFRQALEEPAQDLVAGSRPTTFQATGDMGIGGLERGMQTKRPEAFQQRRVDQNNARLAALEGVQPEGSPIKVADAARQLVSAVTSRAQAAYDDVVAGARRSAEEAAAMGQRSVDDAAGRVGILTQTMGDGTGARASGEAMRSTLEEARAAAKATERALWQAVDPDGSLALSAGNTRQQANELISSMPKSAKPPTGEEAAIFQTVGGYDQTIPFSELTALQSRIKAEMRVERMTNGESPAWRRMAMLSKATDADIETAVAGKMQQEAQAVARGEMSFEDSITARLEQKLAGVLDERQTVTGYSGGASGGFNATRGGTSALSGQGGTGSQTGRRSGPVEGDPGLSSGNLEPNFDPGARDRLTAARTATRERVETFDNKTLGPMRRRPSYSAPYDMAAESVPAKVFYGRPESARAIDQYRAAVGREAADEQIQQYAVSRLRQVAFNADGSVNPGKLDTWRRSHAEALEELPALRQQVDALANSARSLADQTRAADRMGRDAGRAADAEINAASRRHRLLIEAAQRSRLGKIMNADSGDAVVKQVGSVFGRSDSAREMMKLNLAARSDPEAAAGLRRAVVDHILDRFVSNTEAGTSGQSLIKGNQFQTFMKQNKPALRAAGFSDVEIGNMQAIADDIRRANRSITAVRIPGQSNTAQDAFAVQKGDRAPTIMAKLMMASGGLGAKGFGALASIVGNKTLSAMRSAGFETVDDIVADALLNPARARVLLARTTPRSEKGTLKILSDMYTRSVPVTGAVVGGEGQRKSGNQTHDWIEARIRSFGGMSDQGVAESMKRLSEAKPGVAGQIMRELIRVEKLDLDKADKAPAIRYILENILGKSPDAEPQTWRGQRFGNVDKTPLEITIPVPIR